MNRNSRIILQATAGLLAVSIHTAQANSVSDFYTGKQIHLIISTGAGGGYDIYGRPLARHIGKHIPGNPTVIAKNMPGGGGLRAMRHLFNVAEQDGTVLGLVHSSVPFSPLLGVENAGFEATKFNWIGSMNWEGSICVLWNSSGIKSFDEVYTRELVAGSTGAGSHMEVLPNMMNRLLGTKFKIISGFKGGNDVLLAMERGEVHTRCGWSVTSLRSIRPNWLSENKASVLIQTSLERSDDPALKNVPMLLDMAKTDEQKAVMELIFANQKLDRPVLAPPNVPADRVAALRNALRATMDDPGFKAEATKAKLALRYVSGEEIEASIKRAYASPPSVVKAAVEATKSGP